MADPEFEELLKTWHSERAEYRFLEDEFTQINIKAFQGRLSVVRFQIKPTWLSKGLMGERHSGADYEPAEKNRPAKIGIFTTCLRDEDKARRVLAHEMIHHWETTIDGLNEEGYYPNRVDIEISERFSDSQRESSWRRGHSRRFIAKAYTVAATL